MEKRFVILGDNNLWLATVVGTEKDAEKKLKEVKKNVNTGLEEDMMALRNANQLYLYEVKEVKRVSI